LLKTINFNFFFHFYFKGDSGGPLLVKGICEQLEVVGMYLIIINYIKFYFMYLQIF